jgi:small subunit ribosomal protein S6
VKTYEAVYVLRTAEASADWDGTVAELNGIIERYGGKILKANKWGERKLAYEIDHQRRGIYLIIYFEGPEAAVKEIARDARLVGKVLRMMIVVNEDKLGENIKSLPADADDRRRGGRQSSSRQGRRNDGPRRSGGSSGRGEDRSGGEGAKDTEGEPKSKAESPAPASQ